MKLAHKMWLGLGLLIVVPVAFGGGAYLGLGTMDDDLRRLAGFEQPTDEAVEQMERSATGIGLGVLEYLETGGSQDREQVEHHTRAFEESRDRYAGAVETQEGKKLAARIGGLYGEYEAAGDDLMDGRESRDSKLSRADENLRRAGTIAEDIRADADPGEGQEQEEQEKEEQEKEEQEESGGSEKVEAAAEMEAGIAEVGARLGAYSVEPGEESKERMSGGAEDFRAALERFRKLELTEREKDSADELEGLVDETMPLIGEVVSLDASTREDLRRFSGLRADVSEVLGEAQLSATRQDVSAAEEASREASRRVATVVLILLAVDLGVAIAVAIITGRIIRSIRELAQGATKIADGTLDHHIDVTTRDELGMLASSLNRVAEERKHDEEELSHLGGLVKNRMERVAELEGAIADLRNGGQVRRESEERDDLAAATSGYGTFDWDLREDGIYWDDRALEILGLSREEVVPTQEAFLERIHPDDRKKVKDAITAHLEHHVDYDVGYRIRRSDDEYRTCVSYAKTQRDSDGVPLRVVGVINDVTEHRALGERMVRFALRETRHANEDRHAMPRSDGEARASERAGLENDLRLAIERRELVVHYQPVVSLETLKVCAFEGLLRWNHPGRGLLTPAEFLPLAEETGLIVPIGQWVLKEACRQARVWRERYPRDQSLTVSVNLSPRQLDQPDIVESTARTLMDAQLDPRGLVLEVKTNVVTEDSHTTAVALRRLRDLHVGIAIDDYGTARLPSPRLKQLPADILKVDRSLVAKLGEEGEGAPVSEVIGLASEAGLEVVAQGVETYGQLTHLQALGCARAQGYYFSQPVPVREATSILQSN